LSFNLCTYSPSTSHYGDLRKHLLTNHLIITHISALTPLSTMAAELITGALVSTFVEKTIDNLASRFGDIFRGNKSNKKMLSNLKVKLLAIDVVADDAEQKQFTNPRVRDWLLAAKDVVFDAEDLLEEIDDALSKSQAEAESQTAAKKVWNFLKSSFVSFFENEIESRMEKLIENLEDLETQNHVLGLKRNDDVEKEEDCWNLFAKHAFRAPPNQECREIGMKIVEKCKGLPLALP